MCINYKQTLETLFLQDMGFINQVNDTLDDIKQHIIDLEIDTTGNQCGIEYNIVQITAFNNVE